MRCFYHNDLDGHCSAAIVARVFPECKMTEMDYSKPVPLEIIEKDERIYIVDFSFKPEVMNKALEITPNIIWIDHHKSAFEYEPYYKQEIEGIRNKDLAACELTWQVFHQSESRIPLAVTYIGDMDCWKWAYGSETGRFTEGMHIYPNQPNDDIWRLLLGGDIQEEIQKIHEIQENGAVCIKYRDGFSSEYLRSFGFETEFEGYRCYALNLLHMGSLAFGPLYDKYDICIAFAFDGKGYSISLYSSRVDVGKLAQKYNGGGHFGAAGYYVKELPFKVHHG